MACSYCDSPLYGDKCQTCGGTVPSNANTSGLIAEIDAEMEGRQRGYADVRGELLFRCRDDLVTAASAQARIAELEGEVKKLRTIMKGREELATGLSLDMNALAHDVASDMADRATAAEARADRLANGIAGAKLILTPEPGDAPLTEREKNARQYLAALQQETQPYAR